jgi:hypothetical protein
MFLRSRRFAFEAGLLFLALGLGATALGTADGRSPMRSILAPGARQCC